MATSFFKDIKLWTEEANKEVAKETARVTRLVFTMITDRSPYLTGRFIANWQVGATPSTYSVLSTMDWSAKIAEINSVIDDAYFLSHDKAYFVNNLFYTQNVEYTGWTKTIAYAPVQKTLAKIGNGFAPVGQTLGIVAGGII